MVDIKDKPKAFVGSRQWIGSLEVSFVLDSLINVTCRVLNVQQGESVAEYAHDLANHFKKHGTPVMIGKNLRPLLISKYYLYLDTKEWLTAKSNFCVFLYYVFFVRCDKSIENSEILFCSEMKLSNEVFWSILIVLHEFLPLPTPFEKNYF